MDAPSRSFPRFRQKLISLGGIGLLRNRRRANKHEEQRQEPYSKGSILTAVQSRLPYGLNIVNSYFATFNSASIAFLVLAMDQADTAGA